MQKKVPGQTLTWHDLCMVDCARRDWHATYSMRVETHALETTMTASETKARAILDKATELGFRVSVVENRLLRIDKEFTPGDLDAFRKCDTTYYWVLSLLPRTSPGSDWGTDGGGVGGYVAHKSGQFHMYRSGGNKNILRALARML